ncbi:MAG TPA: oxidoreductase [Microbacteriaceae bacterium]|nr:oxidoreductase [Microbacteriaceae bacterium]
MVAATVPLRVGFIGGGFMGAVHSRAARAARASLAGIVSSSAESSAAAAVALGIDSAYASTADLIDDESIDVVHIVTPNATHFELALAALGRGKHVVCEKPLTTSTADATRLVRVAAEAGVTATVPFVYRFHPMVREARARVAAGETGTLVSIQGSYLQDWLLEASDDNWRVAEALGGPSRAFADIGSHLCDMVEFVTGDRIARLQAITRTVFDERSARTVTTEDLAAVLVEMRSGALGTLLVSQLAPGRKNRLHFELNGTEESIEFDQENPELLWLGRRTGSESITRQPGLSADAQRLSVLPPGHPLGYQDAFNAFVADTYAAIGGELHDGLPTFDDGLRAVTLTDAVLESALTSGWINTPERQS